jgi:REP element-mobilizing transposase RayT
MAQSLARLITHLTFSTKLRRPLITPELRADLNAYLSGILNKLESSAIEINCMADHAHVLFCLSRKRSLAEVVEELKKGSSKWIKTKSAALCDFYWQAGYGAFSVSQSNTDVVREYIVNQEEHHRKMTFQEEFRALLAKHQIEFDERYMWD